MASATFTVAVEDPKSDFESLPVSKRLLRSLPHPDASAMFPLLLFAPDGRLIVAGYPSGVVQIFDPVAGKELQRIETPPGYRYRPFHVKLSKDLRTLFGGLDDSKFEPVRDGETTTYQQRFFGGVLVHDIATGKQTKSLTAKPRRGVFEIAPAPDGKRIATFEIASGAEDLEKRRAVYLWDVKAEKEVKLRGGFGTPYMSIDGQRVFVNVSDRKEGTLYVYSAETGKEIGKVSAEGDWSDVAFSPDGRYVAAATTDAKTKKPVVRLFDAGSLEERGTLAANGVDKGAFHRLSFSPNGKRLAAVAGTTLNVWEVEDRTARAWRLDTPGWVVSLSFDAEGQRLAASTWFLPPELRDARTASAKDYPQPKVFLVDLASEKLEVVVCPHGWRGELAFSPEGSLLAVGGAGAVHLFGVGRK